MSKIKMLQQRLPGSTMVPGALRFICLLALAILTWRLFLYDWQVAQENFGSLTANAIYAALLGTALLALGRLVPAVMVAVLLATWFRSISKLKADYLFSPVDASDLKNINTADLWATLAQYPAIVFKIGMITLAALVLGLLTARLWQAHRHLYRLLGLLLAGMALTHVHGQLKESGQHEMIGSGGSLMEFAQSFYLEAADIRSGVQGRAVPTIDCPKEPKNVLLVLQESTFYPKALPSHLSGNLGEFFNQGDLAGPLRVHVFGGFTHLSDFSIQTGVPHSILSGDRMYATKTLEGRLDHTLAKALKACGYETTVIHPITRTYFNARQWYQSVGFDNVLSSQDLQHDPDQYWSIPDKVFFEVALEQARKKDRPQFIYVLTIAQHGPHDQQGDPKAEYLKRLQDSADAYVQLLRQLEGIAPARPWIAAWFGDHRPHLIESDDEDSRYLTWFNIRSIPARPEAGTAYRPALDISFLSSVLLQSVGIQNSLSHAHIDKMIRTCSPNYLACPQDSIARHQDLLRLSGAFSPAP